MNNKQIYSLLLIALSLIQNLCAKDLITPFQIPVRYAWGEGIGGMKAARDLDMVRNEHGTKFCPTINELTRLIGERSKDRKKESPGPAFIVEGIGKEALDNMLVAFKAEPIQFATSEQKISLVFYTRFTSDDVVLDKIEVFDKRIVLTYYFVVRHTRILYPHFALIPLGKLPTGDYKVEIKQLPPINQFGLACKDGDFFIREVR